MNIQGILTVTEEDFKFLINQKELLETALEVFDTVENPSQQAKEQAEVLSMLLENIENLIDSYCSIKEYADMYVMLL